MAKYEDVVAQNAKAFEGSANHQESFTALSSKLGELGYDVLINHKEKQEFVPKSRMDEVATQRDGFKTQLELANVNLETLKTGAKGNDALQAELQKMMDRNTDLLKDLENTKVQTALLIAAKDAINPQDLVAFVNMGNIKTNAKGEVLGVDAEITRLKAEKPYLFTAPGSGGGGRNRAGMENNGIGAGGEKSTMNNMIRRAAGLA